MNLLKVGAAFGGAGGTSLILDSIAASYAAFSTRKLRTAYAGNCIRVRRSNDDAELDIGFSADVLDESALTTFVGANSAFVVTWYDQSGNTRDVTQATAAKQPRIVDTGTVDKNINSKPTVRYDATDDNLKYSSTFLGSAANVVVITTFKYTAVNANNFVFNVTATTAEGFPLQVATNTYLYADSGSAGAHYGDFGTFISTAAVNGLIRYNGGGAANADKLKFYTNGTARTGTFAGGNLSVTLPAAGILHVGNRSDSGSFGMNGNLAELVFFSSALSTSDINAFGNDQATFYGLTWTTVT